MVSASAWSVSTPGAGCFSRSTAASPPGPLDRVEEQLVVVLARHPRRVGQQGEQIGAAVGRRRQRARDRRSRRASAPDGRLAGRRAARRRARDAAGTSASTSPSKPSRMRSRPPSVTGRRPWPAPPSARRSSSTASRSLGRDDGQHPLLALARHHLERLHARLAAGHGAHVDVHAHAAARRRLAGGAGEPGAAEVLDADDEPGVEQRRGRPR